MREGRMFSFIRQKLARIARAFTFAFWTDDNSAGRSGKESHSRKKVALPRTDRSMSSSTDPVAVLEALRRALTPQRLKAFIAGESLFSGGIGIVLYM